MLQTFTPQQADRSAWQALADRSVDPNPFFEPDFVLPAVRHLRGGAHVRLMVVREGVQWLAAIPMLHARRWRNVPAVVQGPWTHEYGFLGAPLTVPGATGERALVTLLERLRRRTGFVPLELLPATGSAAATARRLGPVNGWRDDERAAVRRRPTDDYECTGLSSKHRRELRRQRRLLEERVGALTVTEDEHVATVDALLDLEAAGWKGQEGTAMRTAGHEAFLRETCDAFAARGRLQSLLLRVDGRPAAAKLNLLTPTAAFCFKIGFDERLARYSPGVQLELENLRAFHRREELQWMDSCADPGNDMINRLWPDRRPLTSLLLAGRGPLGRLGRAEATVLSSVHHRRLEGHTT